MKIILATKNKSKIKEMNSIFSDTGIQFVSMDDFLSVPEIKEDGKTYHENAFKKAILVHEKTGLPVVSEDSGLEVDALNRVPGIFSARFAGENASDKENIQKLLRLIKDVPEKRRRARFISVFCIINNEKERFFEGEVRGKIIDTPRGDSGFGYDPVFIPEGYEKTFAELGDAIKNKISHRANAMKKLREYLVTKRG